MPIEGKIVGDIHVNVCETPQGATFYYLDADNKEVIHILDYLEDSLKKFKD